MVPWEASNNEGILNEARFEIARSVAWGKGEEPPTKPADVLAYLQQHAPPVYDPFCGGGSIPLEAQRLGLRAYGSDLNPVAVLITKALVEIPPKFAGQKPLNPEVRAKKELIDRRWKGAQGLAEDVRYYGHWMRTEAEKRIGHLYPRAKMPDGSEAKVIAWLWTRTVRSPDPAAKGAHVPLASTFWLSRKGSKAWADFSIDDRAQDGWRFEVRLGEPPSDKAGLVKDGTVNRSGGKCLLTNSPIPYSYLRSEAMAGRFRERLMALVCDTSGGRTYVSPLSADEDLALAVEPSEAPPGVISHWPGRTNVVKYGMTTFASLFTMRQLKALTTFSDMIAEARANILAEAGHHFPKNAKSDIRPLHDGGEGAVAYADAVSLYLAFSLSKAAGRNCSVAIWEPGMGRLAGAFGRQAMPMQWAFAETNPIGDAGGDISGTAVSVSEVLDRLASDVLPGQAVQIDAPSNNYPVRPICVSTDPPYYDNVGYADLSDFFYVWLRRTLSNRGAGMEIWPTLFRRLQVPQDEELVAKPHNDGGRESAESKFMDRMSKALKAMHDAADPSTPLTIYYAFKEAESAEGGLRAGWATFLQAVSDAGLAIDGTWPIRTEATNALKADLNALASSIVLVCRKRDPKARAIERDEFKRTLRRELPDALTNIRAAGVGPVDMAQAAIGPGMGVFTRYSAVLEASGEAMKVKDALKLINEVRDEVEDEGDYDLETRFAVEWFAEAQWETKESGRAILLANAKNLAESQLERAGIIDAHAGKTRLRTRAEIGAKYDPDDDKTPTVWEHAQALAYALEQGGQDAAAALFARLNNTESVRALAYRLYGICERKGWSAEALVWNRLAEEWRRIEDLAASSLAPEPARETDLFGGAA